MHAKPLQLFQQSTGVMLLALAAALSLSTLTSPVDLAVPLDPVFGFPRNTLFWIVAGLALATALVSLFADQSEWPLSLLAWLGLNASVYIVGAYAVGWHGVLGLLVGFTYAFDLRPNTASLLLISLAAYLLAGSLGARIYLFRLKHLEQKLLRTACPNCGGRLKFARQDLGTQRDCPHCHKAFTLRGSELLKMSCFFCKGHIEFPAHALGTKMACPHCKMDITLRE